jgi:hypothetical protein
MTVNIKVCNRELKSEGRLVRIARLDGEQFSHLDDPETMINGLRECEVRTDLFTFMQSPPETAPKYLYHMEWDNLAVLPVSTFQDWWMHQIRSEARTKARKAEKKGVVLSEIPFDDAFLRGMCAIYNECPIRQGRPFPHYGMGIDKARSYAGTFIERSIFIGAFLDDCMIGFIKLITDERLKVACAIHVLSLIQHTDKAPTNALIAKAVQSCADRGISFLVYGNMHYGRKTGDSLSQFKETNGFRRTDLPRYYVPLSPLGSIALRLGLHHRLTDYCPEIVMEQLRELRKTWYMSRLRGATAGL